MTFSKSGSNMKKAPGTETLVCLIERMGLGPGFDMAQILTDIEADMA